MGARVILSISLLAACGPTTTRASTPYTSGSDDSGTEPKSIDTTKKTTATGSTGGSDVETLDPPPVQLGSWTAPDIIANFPGTIEGNTATSKVSSVSSYSCAPTWNESGPEVVYKLTAPADGTFTVTLNDIVGDGVDIDLHLLSGASGGKCIDSEDTALTHAMKAGESYYLSFDSAADDTGNVYSGVYSATVTFAITAPAKACPSDMMSVPFQNGVCMDKYEAPNVSGQKPLVMYDFDEAESWCKAKSKRLCFEDEWTFACATAAQNPYPYGIVHSDACDESNAAKTVADATVAKWTDGISTPTIATYDALIAAAKAKAADASVAVAGAYQADGAGKFPGCTNVFGTYDMAGSVQEWTRRRDGTGTTHGNIKGSFWSSNNPNYACQTNAKSKADSFRNYEAGFRCCADNK